MSSYGEVCLRDEVLTTDSILFPFPAWPAHSGQAPHTERSAALRQRV
jgi:hypothetical protein